MPRGSAGRFTQLGTFFLGCRDANKGKHRSLDIHLKVSMLPVSFHESLPLSQYPGNLKTLLNVFSS